MQKYYFLLLALGCVATWHGASADERYFEVQVVDEETGRGVPLVEIETTNNIRYVTDSAGRVAFDEPGLVGRDVFLKVQSHGYEFPADGFGMRGKRVRVESGGRVELQIKRLNIAERLYRITGGGIYRDSELLGHETPIAQPLLNGQVLGSDSVLNAVHNGKLYWFWGDTNRPQYPLGLFHTAGATSTLPGDGGLDPSEGVDLEYFVGEDGFARAMAPMKGEGPTWIDAVASIPNAKGEQRLVMAYAKIKPPLSTYERGLGLLNEEEQVFEKMADVDLETPVRPAGHAVAVGVGGKRHLYFATPFPLARAVATVEGYRDLDQYEAFTCLQPGSTVEDPQWNRDDAGRLVYAWQRGTPAVGHDALQKHVKAGELNENDVIQFRDRDTQRIVVAHNGTVYWNAYRERWIMIFNEIGGKHSLLGDVWYAEADTPVGSWAYAVNVANHEKYDFYNPKLHPEFDQEGGGVIYFEGTYTNTFSGNPVKTPRYEYNQLMYRIRLDDPRCRLPLPVYEHRDDEGVRYHLGIDDASELNSVAWYALEGPDSGSCQAVYADGDMLTAEQGEGGAIAFYGLPLDGSEAPEGTAALFRYENSQTDESIHRIETDAVPEGFERVGEAVCRVWVNPIAYAFDVKTLETHDAQAGGDAN